MAINTQKLVPSSFSSQQVSQEKLIEVKRSVIDVEKLMTGIIAFEKKKQDTQRQVREEKRYQKREEQLEKKEIKKQFKLNLPSLPRMGFFDWIKNFVTNTLLGFFAVRLLKYVPQLVGVAGAALNASESILNFAGGLLNGVATFVEWGYKAYDATRGFLKQIGGENLTQLFDKFLGGLDLFLSLTLGASVFKIGREVIGKVLERVLGFIGAGVFGIGTNRVGTARALRKLTPEQAQKALSRLQQTLSTPQRTRIQKKIVSRSKVMDLVGASDVSQPKAPTTRTLGISLGDRQTLRKMASPDVSSPGLAGKPGSEFEQLKKTLSSRARTKYAGAEQLVAQQIADEMNRGVDPFKLKSGDVSRDLLKGGINRRPKSPLDPYSFYGPSGRARPLSPIGEKLMENRLMQQAYSIDPSGATLGYVDKKLIERETRLGKYVGEDLYKFKRAANISKIRFLRQAKTIFGRFKIPIIGGLLDFALSVALGEDPGRAAFRAIGAGLLGAVGGVVGSVIPVAGSLIGGALGGAGGDYLGGLLYDAIFGGKKPQTLTKDQTKGFAGGGEVGRGPQKQVKKRREYLAEPSQDPIELGKDVGQKRFEEMFPKGSSGGLFGVGSKDDAYGYLQSGYGLLSGAGFFGPLFGIAIKALTGDKPSSTDYRAASFGLSNWMTSTFGNVAMQGFANGGLVGGNMFLDSRQIQRTIESSLEERVTSEVDDAINELRRRLGIEGKKDKGEGETSEYPEPNKKRTGSGYKPATPGSFNVIEYITGDPRHANYKYDHGTVKNYHDHIAFATKEDKERAKAALRAAGIEIGSEDRPDDTRSYHSTGLAIDIPGAQWGGSGAIGSTEYDGSAKVRSVLGLFKGGPTGKGGLFNLHENEWVVDFDSRKLYGDAFLHIVNATENESQRKQNSLRLMSILQSYAGYESGFEQMVTVPVPAPQMIPVPVPMQSNEPMMMPSGGGSSGRASDILESIG